MLAACGLVFLVVWATIGILLTALRRFKIVDQPNERSSHTTPTPRGGGFALVPILLTAWVGYVELFGAPPPGFLMVVLGTVILWFVSSVDDVRGGVSPAIRIAVQALAVALGIIGLEGLGPVFQGLLPRSLDWLAAAVLWLWFVNLFNFMDGIDGLSGVEATCVGTGLGLTAWMSGWTETQAALPLLLAASLPGFLVWNWQPARIFLGDAGSIPIGYLLGWLLLLAASSGAWGAALILPAYYLADATITLGLRCIHGERPWQAHREHFYQRAVRGGLDHAAVALRILAANIVLIILALAATQGYAIPCVLGATIVVGCVLWVFQRRGVRGTM